jgi:hypothetical protein
MCAKRAADTLDKCEKGVKKLERKIQKRLNQQNALPHIPGLSVSVRDYVVSLRRPLNRSRIYLFSPAQNFILANIVYRFQDKLDCSALAKVLSAVLDHKEVSSKSLRVWVRKHKVFIATHGREISYL